jgi:hypothetical protein
MSDGPYLILVAELRKALELVEDHGRPVLLHAPTIDEGKHGERIRYTTWPTEAEAMAVLERDAHAEDLCVMPVEVFEAEREKRRRVLPRKRKKEVES